MTAADYRGCEIFRGLICEKPASNQELDDDLGRGFQAGARTPPGEIGPLARGSARKNVARVPPPNALAARFVDEFTCNPKPL